MKPGRELDARIEVEVMGRPGEWHDKVRINGTWVDVTTWIPDYATAADPPKGSYAGTRPPAYSTSIVAAWEVIEKLLALGAAASLFSHECLPGFAGTVLGDVRWSVEVVPDGNKPRPITTSSAEADTAPEAICLAALNAVGVTP